MIYEVSLYFPPFFSFLSGRVKFLFYNIIGRVIDELTTFQLKNAENELTAFGWKFWWFPTKIKDFLTNPDDNLQK